MSLTDSPSFLREMQAGDAIARANPGYVYLISRFGDDDSTICYFGSMGYREAALPTGIGGVESVTLLTFKGPKKVQLTEVQPVFIAGSEFVPANQVPVIKPQQGGGHAEELFLRKFEKLCAEFGKPNKIDIFISKIPCAKVSSGWMLTIAQGNVILPCGCSSKLALVARHWSDITWRIWWRDAYPNPTTQSDCLKGLAELQGAAIVQQYVG
jgi:hypothetical protein